MSADTSRRDDRVTGHRPGSAHLLAAAGASLGGLRRLLAETAFRHEIALLAAIVALFALVGAGRADYGIALVLWRGLVAEPRKLALCILAGGGLRGFERFVAADLAAQMAGDLRHADRAHRGEGGVEAARE